MLKPVAVDTDFGLEVIGGSFPQVDCIGWKRKKPRPPKELVGDAASVLLNSRRTTMRMGSHFEKQLAFRERVWLFSSWRLQAAANPSRIS